jgi:hypothetical protein
VAEELTRVLEQRAERGSPRGATAVLAAARQRPATHQETGSWWRRGPALAVATAVVALVVVGAALLATRLLGTNTTPAATIPPAPTTVPSAPTTTVPMPDTHAEAGVTRLERVQTLEAVRLSTSIGEIEFTTWVGPDGGAWIPTETGHGLVGGLGEDGVPGWSLDGITWTEIRYPDRPAGWSDQSAAAAEDVVVWSVGDGVGRAVWDGTGWGDAEILSDRRLDGATGTVVGSDGIVVVRNGIYYWDGTEFATATRPPHPSLYPGSGAGCGAQNSFGSSAVPELLVATDDGFVTTAHFPGCEPLLWFSTDGNEWAPLTDEWPFGEGAAVRDLAFADGRLVAVGGTSYWESAMWVSDDGVTWHGTEVISAHLQMVAGNTRGWIAAGNGNQMWFSPDGSEWDGPYQRPPGWESSWGLFQLTMLDDRIIGAGDFHDAPPGVSASSGFVIGVFVDD